MKTFAHLTAVTSAILIALSSASAQITTLSTTANFNGSSSNFSANQTKGETFTSIAAISSFKYSFFSAGNSNATSLAAQWAVYNGSGNQNLLSNWTTVQNFGTITIPSFVSANTNGWTQFSNGNGGPFNTYEVNFDFGGFLATNPASTYSLLLTNQNAFNAGVTLGFDTADTFTNGDATVGFGSFADYTFANIVYVKSGDIVPTPEASTMASIAGALLVAGLVIFRVRQRSHLQSATVAA